MPKAIDLTGQTFGKLTICEYVGSRVYGGRKKRFYLCKCECGGVIERPAEYIRTGRITSCGCLRWQSGSDSPKWTGYGEISGNYRDHIKRGAANRNYDFQVSIEEAWDLFLQQDRCCVISGISLTFESRQNKRSKFGTASFDRINSQLGYITGNVQWVHKDINRMKQHFDEKYFFEMCSLVHEHQERK